MLNVTPAASMMSVPVVASDADNLKSHLLRIKGDDNGQYFNSQYKPMPSKLTLLKTQETELQKQWERHCQQQVNYGNPVPQGMTPELQERKDKLDAKRIVCEEEIRWLQEKIKEAEAVKAAREKKKVQPRFWGSGQLRDGILIEFCGWSVGKNEEGILCIDDPDSPYNSCPVWKLKSQIVNPMHAEFRLRQWKETQAALDENRKRREVRFPKPPTFDHRSGNIEYPGSYDPSTIRKLKLEDV